MIVRSQISICSLARSNMTTLSTSLRSPMHPKPSHNNTTVTAIVTTAIVTTLVVAIWVAVVWCLVWCPVEWWAQIWVLVTMTMIRKTAMDRNMMLGKHSPSSSFLTAWKRFATMATSASSTLWRNHKQLRIAFDILRNSKKLPTTKNMSKIATTGFYKSSGSSRVPTKIVRVS